MKTKEELNALKKEIEDLNEKCRELTEEDLENVTGGITKEPEFKAGKARKDSIR